VDPAERVLMDVYIEPTSAISSHEDGGAGSRLAGTLAFTTDPKVGEEQFFIVNVPPDMRFDEGEARITLSMTGLEGPIETSAVRLVGARFLK